MTTKLASPPRPPDAEHDGAPRVTVRHLESIADFEQAVRVYCQVWNTDTAEDLVNVSLMVAWSLSDNYVAGVFMGDEMVGAAIAWRGRGHIHSHMVGVHPKCQGLGLGYRLKQHESAWAREQGLPVIRWTFDPLVRRNAHFNLSKLDTQVLAYAANAYGALNDGLNEGDETDRLLIEWNADAPAGPPRAEECGADLIGAPPPEAARWDFDARPDATVTGPDGTVRLVVLPDDIEELRLHDPARARRWRYAVRAGLRTAMADGFLVTGFSSDGCYVLRRP